MDSIDNEILKMFSTLSESEKNDFIELVKNMSAMTKEQFAIFNELIEKTLKTVQESRLNKNHASFMRYAAKAVKDGATLTELLQEWEGSCRA